MAFKKEPKKVDEKEEERKVALANLKSSIANLGAIYLIENSKGYGENISSVVEQYAYVPLITSKEGSGLIYNSLFSSRTGGKRYSGSVSELQILENAAKLLQGSIANITVQDALDLMGSKVKVNEKYNNIYLGELLSSENEDSQKLGNSIFQTYQGSIMDKVISDSLNKRVKSAKGELEKLVV